MIMIVLYILVVIVVLAIIIGSLFGYNITKDSENDNFNLFWAIVIIVINLSVSIFCFNLKDADDGVIYGLMFLGCAIYGVVGAYENLKKRKEMEEKKKEEQAKAEALKHLQELAEVEQTFAKLRRTSIKLKKQLKQARDKQQEIINQFVTTSDYGEQSILLAKSKNSTCDEVSNDRREK